MTSRTGPAPVPKSRIRCVGSSGCGISAVGQRYILKALVVEAALKLRTRSQRLRGVGPASGAGTPPTDAQVIAGTILGIANMAINGRRW